MNQMNQMNKIQAAILKGIYNTFQQELNQPIPNKNKQKVEGIISQLPAIEQLAEMNEAEFSAQISEYIEFAFSASRKGVVKSEIKNNLNYAQRRVELFTLNKFGTLSQSELDKNELTTEAKLNKWEANASHRIIGSAFAVKSIIELLHEKFGGYHSNTSKFVRFQFLPATSSTKVLDDKRFEFHFAFIPGEIYDQLTGNTPEDDTNRLFTEKEKEKEKEEKEKEEKSGDDFLDFLEDFDAKAKEEELARKTLGSHINGLRKISAKLIAIFGQRIAEQIDYKSIVEVNEEFMNGFILNPDMEIFLSTSKIFCYLPNSPLSEFIKLEHNWKLKEINWLSAAFASQREKTLGLNDENALEISIGYRLNDTSIESNVWRMEKWGSWEDECWERFFGCLFDA